MSKELIFALRDAAPQVEKEYCSPFGLLIDSAADALESQAREIEELKSTPLDKREDLRCVISDLCQQVRELEINSALTQDDLREEIKELRAALVEAVEALEVVCKYDREERDQPYEAGELALTRCKEVLK